MGKTGGGAIDDKQTAVHEGQQWYGELQSDRVESIGAVVVQGGALMAKPDWARKKVYRLVRRMFPQWKHLDWESGERDQGGMFSIADAVSIARAERRRAVRVVGKVQQVAFGSNTMNDEQYAAYRQACADILAALKEA